ncbi:hypothetical protein Tsubulata_002285 [Turnera subulata]|uniref:DUF4283 domain-containing protein n=1 Tax=Turnera subulata TaxID=218843 RepID=A0A9Q0FX73_9ROSI|nr:hypothetical protein Tsubulata_002285 [Turnera subulata]
MELTLYVLVFSLPSPNARFSLGFLDLVLQDTDSPGQRFCGVQSCCLVFVNLLSGVIFVTLILRSILEDSEDIVPQRNQKLWNPMKGMEVEQLNRNLFLFKFFSRKDRLEVIDAEKPRFFVKQLVVMKPITWDEVLSKVELLETPAWIRMLNISLNSRTKKNVESIASKAGRFIYFDEKGEAGWDKFVMDHILKECEQRSGESDEEEVWSYGEWLRASPHKPYSTKATLPQFEFSAPAQLLGVPQLASLGNLESTPMQLNLVIIWCLHVRPESQNKYHTWDLLRQLHNSTSLPWLIMGYFNELLFYHEKEGGWPRDYRCMKIFRDALTYCKFSDLGYMENTFTWANNQEKESDIKERLDTDVANATWKLLYCDHILIILPRKFSDHSPLLLHSTHRHQSVEIERIRSFRFEKIRLREASFREEVSIACMASTLVSNPSAITSRLDYYALQFKTWNVCHFGSVNKQLK